MGQGNLLKSSLRLCRGAALSLAGAGFLINLLTLSLSVYMIQLFDRVVLSKSVPTLLFLTLIIVFAMILLGTFEALRSRVLVRVGTWLDRVISPELPRRTLDRVLHGDKIPSDSFRDLAQLRSFLGGSGAVAVIDCAWVPLYLGVVFLLHPVLGLVATFGAVALLVCAIVNDRVTALRLKEAEVCSAKGMRIIGQMTRHAEVVEAMGMAGALERRWSGDSDKALALQERASDLAGTVYAVSKATRMLLQVAILAVGVWLVIVGELSIGAAFAASLISARALAPVEAAISSWKQAMGAREAYRRLETFLEHDDPARDSLPLPPLTGRVEVIGVTYTPPGTERASLKDVTFALEPGTILGIIGPSAAGKSTLTRLLLGLGRPQLGSIRLDGAEALMWRRDQLGPQIGYLPQTVELFDGTAAENIARMGPIDPEAVIVAARMAGIHEMVLGFAKGYETPIGEQGCVLSAGQRQRLGLARALYGAPKLVVLDEPNANLDADGEQALAQAIEALRATGTTIIIVSHRPAILGQAEKILVLRNGFVNAFGPRAQVMDAMVRRPNEPMLRPVPVSASA